MSLKGLAPWSSEDLNGITVPQVVVVDHDSDPELVRVDAKAAEAIDLHCDQGPVACIQVRSRASHWLSLPLTFMPDNEHWVLRIPQVYLLRTMR